MEHAEPPEVGRARDIDHWVVLVNPVSTNSLRVNRAMETLHGDRHFSRTLDHVLPRQNGGMAGALKRALERLDADSGLMIAGGDGTVHHAVNALLSPGNEELAVTPVLALGAGYGNDIALSLSSRAYLDNLPKLLRQARVEPIHPIESLITSGDSHSTRYAVAYMGFGGTARGAERFDSDDFRRQALRKSVLTRWLTDGVGVARTVLENEAYEVFNMGRTVRISECSVANFPREAKHGRWPVSVNKPDLYLSFCEGASVVRSTTWLGRLALGNNRHLAPVGSYLPPSDSFSFHVESPQLPAHWDAEVQRLSEGTEVTIRSSAKPFYAVTTSQGV
jgi:hypothetical protein